MRVCWRIRRRRRFEIMHPAAYMAHAPVPVLRLPDIHPLIDADYAPYDVGVMGEFDVRILTELFGGRADCGRADSGVEWRHLLRGAAEVGGDGGGEGVDGVAWAALLLASGRMRIRRGRFCGCMRGSCRGSTPGWCGARRMRRTRASRCTRPTKAMCCCRSSGTGVFVSEGFPLALARKLRDSIASVQSDAPLQVAAAARRAGESMRLSDPGLALVRMLSSAGVMKAAMAAAERCCRTIYFDSSDSVEQECGQRDREQRSEGLADGRDWHHRGQRPVCHARA